MSRLRKINGLYILEISKGANCCHPKLMLEKKTGETICVKCRRTIYMSHKPDYLFGNDVSNNLNKPD
ncbi:MAG: hypothetical protein V4565_00410 [Bacteroidota bacterium]